MPQAAVLWASRFSSGTQEPQEVPHFLFSCRALRSHPDLYSARISFSLTSKQLQTMRPRDLPATGGRDSDYSPAQRLAVSALRAASTLSSLKP